MSRRTGPTQAEITRAIKAVQATGLNVSGVEIEGSKIVILTSSVGKELSKPDDDLERWLKWRAAKERNRDQSAREAESGGRRPGGRRARADRAG